MKRFGDLSINQKNVSRTAARRGVVLLIVLIVVVLVSLAGFGFAAMMFVEHKAVRLRGEQLEIEQALGSAEVLLGQMAKKMLRPATGTGEGGFSTGNIEGGTAGETGIYDRPSLLQSRALIPGIEEPGTIRFTVVSPRRELIGESSGLPGELPIRYGVEDESSRLNLGVLIEWEGRVPGSGRAALLKLPGMTEEIADAILDWLDADDSPRELGAEGEYYSTLVPAYAARNGIPQAIEELLLVKGVTRRMLFGSDENQNGIIEEGELQGEGNQEFTGVMDEGGEGWLPYLTLYSREMNVNSKGEPRVRLNDPDLSRLYLKLSAIEKSWGEFIVAYRQYGPMSASVIPPANTPTVETFSPDLKVAAQFRIQKPLELVDAKVLIPAASGKPATIVASPFKSSPEELQKILAKMLDELTVIPDSAIDGRINLNSASRRVLGMIPGLPEEAVERIVSGQDRVTGAVVAERLTPAWLLSENVIDRVTFESILPFVGCRGDVFRAQIVGYSSESRLATRVEVAIDVSSRSPRRLYWKDLQIWGRGYEWGVLDPSLMEEGNPTGSQGAGAAVQTPP